MKHLLLVALLISTSACAALTTLGIGIGTGIVLEEDKPNAIDILPESQDEDKYGE